jgi:hypothetical protein
MLDAIEPVSKQVGNAGIVAADFHIGNFAYTPRVGGLRAIPFDHGFVYTIEGFLQQIETNRALRQVVGGWLGGTKYAKYMLDPAQRPTNAAAWMDALFEVRKAHYLGLPPP